MNKQETIESNLKKLFYEYFKTEAESISKLPQHGSARIYYRIQSGQKTAIGVYNETKKENKMFVYLSEIFKKNKLNVPQIYIEKLENNIYLEEDLGDITLFDYIQQETVKEGKFGENIIKHYQSALEELIKFQKVSGIDYNLCYPRHSFDRTSMLWDMNYFKYYFIKLANIDFNEEKLENDFIKFANFLSKSQGEFFMYRDFQSRNIMIKDERLYFIDYQGGRKGALQYDVASLLFDAKANIPTDIRQNLLNHYIKHAKKIFDIDEKLFTDYYYGFVLIRIMQAMGAYGYRGFYEQKSHFLKSIPYAIKNLQWILENYELPIKLPELEEIFYKITSSPYLKQFNSNQSSELTINISSFSYRNGIPRDTSGHGGGFVFDVRFLPNPHYEDSIKHLTGKDQKIIEWLDNKKEVQDFLEQVKKILKSSITVYKKKGYTSLIVQFGCTGGKHRSVYCAEKIAKYIKNELKVDVKTEHRDIPKN